MHNNGHTYNTCKNKKHLSLYTYITNHTFEFKHTVMLLHVIITVYVVVPHDKIKAVHTSNKIQYLMDRTHLIVTVRLVALAPKA